MLKKSRGQEATEFVLITSLVFIASLLTMFIFRDQIALFFKNNTTAQKHEVADYTASTNSANAIGGKASVDHPGGTVSIKNVDGSEVIVDLPNPSAFTQSETAAKTTGSSADMLKLASDLGMYNLALGDSIQEISNQTSNATISKIAKIVAAMGQLQGGGAVPGVLNYDTSTNPTWKDALDDLTPQQINKNMNAIIDSLDTTLAQLQDESQTTTYSGNNDFIENCSSKTCLNTSFKIDGTNYEMSGMKQQDYARFLKDTLEDLSSDSTVSADIKATVTALANEASKIADEYTYKVTASDTDTDAAFNVMNTVNTNYSYSYYNVSGYNSGWDKHKKGEMFVKWWKNFNQYGNYSYLSSGDYDKLAKVAKSLAVSVNTPTGGAVTTDLASQIEAAVSAPPAH